MMKELNSTMHGIKKDTRKVLIVATTFLCVDGLTSVLLHLARIISEYCVVDFSLGAGADSQIVTALGEIGEVFFLPNRKTRTLKYISALKGLVDRKCYDIVHIHGNSSTMAVDLIATRRTKVRITHCHNCAKQNIIKQFVLGTMMNLFVTHPVACSRKAGEAIYSKPFTVIRNGIDTNRFVFRQDVREKVREQFGLNDAYVIGHIGRFNHQKNQDRLIGILMEVLQIRQDAVLMLCGKGELENEFQEKAKQSGLMDHILLIGEVNDPEKYMMAMDVFVLPSLFEGLPLAGVEAQASGLPCVFSDSITKETAILPAVSFLSLEESNRRWAEVICCQTMSVREKAASEICSAGYGLNIVHDQICDLYGIS